MIPLTDEEKESYENQKVCPICKKEISTDKKYCKVRDHFHNTGIFRGAAHNNCSLRYKIPKEIPVVFTKKKKRKANYAKKEKFYLDATISVLKIIDYITSVKNVMMNHINQ